MSVYAPQTGCSEHDKDDFYLSLEEAIRSVPEGDYLSIAGDMNGHVGSGRRGVERVRGGKGIGLINPDGERILDLAIAHDLSVCSTFFAKRESQKVTYASGGRRTEVDHILVRRAALKTVRDVKVIPGESGTSYEGHRHKSLRNRLQALMKKDDGGSSQVSPTISVSIGITQVELSPSVKKV
ncbi:unnamed protein product [Heligmosomoides polygyrus]|uniref:Endo/exonuclease/phosphatase domain-containing protein n=1 Tax=Heligmosomoides polygyrus TaxID=6339 RepID=A0A183FE09_HELPZ|nr:unnamed protein product [Heligmosomoides polygyrus]